MEGMKELFIAMTCCLLICKVYGGPYGGERHGAPYSYKNLFPGNEYGTIKGLHSAARKWGPFKDECHVACDKPYLTSYNVMANVQGRKLCPEYFNLPGNDILVTGANWRAMCKEKNVVLCTYCFDITKKHIQKTAHYGSSAGHLMQVCNYTAPPPESCNQWMDMANGTCNCQPYEGKGEFYKTDTFKNIMSVKLVTEVDPEDYNDHYNGWKYDPRHQKKLNVPFWQYGDPKGK